MDSNPRSPVRGGFRARDHRAGARCRLPALGDAHRGEPVAARPAATAGRGSAAASERAHRRRPRKRRCSGAAGRLNHIRADRCWVLLRCPKACRGPTDSHRVAPRHEPECGCVACAPRLRGWSQTPEQGSPGSAHSGCGRRIGDRHRPSEGPIRHLPGPKLISDVADVR